MEIYSAYQEIPGPQRKSRDYYRTHKCLVTGPYSEPVQASTHLHTEFLYGEFGP
jgi:hypothetical protein